LKFQKSARADRELAVGDQSKRAFNVIVVTKKIDIAAIDDSARLAILG